VISYQGYLTDSGGIPVNGDVEITFSIYDTPTGGTALWAETHPSVSVSDGLFNVLLGSVNPITPPLLTGETYLGIRVEGDEEMSPRQQIAAVAYALRSAGAYNAENLDGMDSTEFVKKSGDSMNGRLAVENGDPLTWVIYGRNSSQHFSFGGLGHTNFGVYGGSTIGGVFGYGEEYGVRGEYHRPSQVEAESYGVLGRMDGVGVYGNGLAGVSGEGSDTGVYGKGGDWDFYARGPGTNYGPFTGAHEAKLSADFPQNIQPGMIVSVTGETQMRQSDEGLSFSSTLPTVELSGTINDSKVLGAIIAESALPEGHWYSPSEGERFGIVNALGEGRVWVTNVNGDIQAGDCITTSAIVGYGQKQDDDLLHSYTLGKAIESVDWSKVTETVEFDGNRYQAYPLGVIYTSG
jgi:hypothetical protein